MYTCKSQNSIYTKKTKSVEKVQPIIYLQRPKTSRVKSPRSLMHDHKMSSSVEYSKSQKTIKTAQDSHKLKKTVSDQIILK